MSAHGVRPTLGLNSAVCRRAGEALLDVRFTERQWRGRHVWAQRGARAGRGGDAPRCVVQDHIAGRHPRTGRAFQADALADLIVETLITACARHVLRLSRKRHQRQCHGAERQSEPRGSARSPRRIGLPVKRRISGQVAAVAYPITVRLSFLLGLTKHRPDPCGRRKAMRPGPPRPAHDRRVFPNRAHAGRCRSR